MVGRNLSHIRKRQIVIKYDPRNGRHRPAREKNEMATNDAVPKYHVVILGPLCSVLRQMEKRRRRQIKAVEAV